MRILVTGVAGFIGSHLAERLLSDRNEVVGVDSFTEFYGRAIKERNLAGLKGAPGFTLVESDLLEADLGPMVEDCGGVFHLAAQPGVRASWGADFKLYCERNILATQRLLEAVKARPLKKFVFASSSSVYGEAEMYPTSEAVTPRPLSPYGATKLAAEQLCYLYWKNFGVPIIALRYFSVFGPRQRPDMALSRFIEALFTNREIVVYGDGEQMRDFTYVNDAVNASILAMASPSVGQVFNIGQGSRLTVNEAIRKLEAVTGWKARVRYLAPVHGDVRSTCADTSKAKQMLGYQPQVDIDTALLRQVEWSREILLAAHLREGY